MIQQLAAEGNDRAGFLPHFDRVSVMCDQVGIIERGRLLAVGSVEQIRNEMQGHLQIRIVPLDRAGELAQWLVLETGFRTCPTKTRLFTASCGWNRRSSEIAHADGSGSFAILELPRIANR